MLLIYKKIGLGDYSIPRKLVEKGVGALTSIRFFCLMKKTRFQILWPSKWRPSLSRRSPILKVHTSEVGGTRGMTRPTITLRISTYLMLLPFLLWASSEMISLEILIMMVQIT